MAALIMSLRREQQAAEDRVVFDAWQNGGAYKGKPMDDDRLLAYIKGRRDGYTKDDPLYDEWDNRLTQYGFSIGEQKIGLAYKQGKVGAGAVAAFYRDQLKSIPKDSAFYREVAGRAAQFAQSTASAARGRARGRATAGKREKLNRQLETQQNYLQLEAALTEYARREGLISGTQTLADADATDLEAMFDRGIYAGEDRITLDDFRGAAQDHYKALGAEIQTRLDLGQQAIEARNKRSRFLNGTLVRLNAVDERSQYEMARENWLESVQAAQGNPWAVRDANDAYLEALRGIHTNASAAGDGPEGNDPEFIGGLANEFEAIATGTAKGKTVADLYDLTDEAGTVQDQAAATQQLQADLDALDKNQAYFGQDEPGGPMGVVYWPQGGVASPLGMDDSLQPTLTSVNGEKRLVYLKGEPVKSSTVRVNDQVIDPSDPDFADIVRQARAEGTLEIDTSDTPVGYVFTNPVNGARKYGVYDEQGKMLFTELNPWSADGSTAGIVNNGGVQTVFTGRVTAQGRPATTGLSQRPVNLATADPLLADSTVAPKDLMRLAEAGLKDFAPEDVAAYQMRLQKQEQERVTALSNRDRGLTDIAGVGRQRVDDPGRRQSPDARDSILDGMNAVRTATQSLFGSRVTTDDIYVPPPAPRSATPTIVPTPTPKPAATTAKKPLSAPKPVEWTSGSGRQGDVTVTDKGTAGRGAGGSWDDPAGRGAGGMWGDPVTLDPTPKKGKGGFTQR